RWPTAVTRDHYLAITGEPLPKDRLDYFCNNRIAYTVRGVHVDLTIRWDLALPAGDTHFAALQGTASRIEIRQSADRPGPPELFVVPFKSEVKSALEATVATLSRQHAGLAVLDEGGEYRVAIPAALRIGHEAHFAQVTAEFLGYLANQRDVPAWERPNLLAKYFVTTQGETMAQP